MNRQLLNLLKGIICLVMVHTIVWIPGVNAHEVRPAYLEIKELESDRYNVFWKVPLKGTMKLKISPELPDHFKTVSPPEIQMLSDAIVEQWQIVSESGGFEGETISIEGLNMTITDVLVHIEFLDGRSYNRILRPSEPTLIIPEKETSAQIAWTYLVLGVEHILGGIDHLLFVLALLLLVNNKIHWTLR